jgi:predicted RNA binding protein YcfA (HicA-like mRNA interferase family)
VENMPKLPRAKEIIRVARKLGFYFSRQSGSHAIFRHPDGRRITVPIHGGKEIGPALFNQILKDLKISKKKFWEIL